MDAAPNTRRETNWTCSSLLVHDYEDRKFPIDKPDLSRRFASDAATGLATKDLVPLLGSRSRVSEVPLADEP